MIRELYHGLRLRYEILKMGLKVANLERKARDLREYARMGRYGWDEIQPKLDYFTTRAGNLRWEKSRLESQLNWSH